MSRVEEIEAAIESLPPDDYRRIIDWLIVRDQRQWDAQLDADSSSGKLDFLFEEADSDAANGLLRDWPPQA